MIMKRVEIKFKKLEIVRAFPRDNSVEIRLLVSDGKDKALDRSVKLDNTAESADDLIKEACDKIKMANKSVQTSGDFLSSLVVFKMIDEQDVVMEKITKFLTSAREKVRVANAGKMSYYDMEMQLKKTVLQF